MLKMKHKLLEILFTCLKSIAKSDQFAMLAVKNVSGPLFTCEKVVNPPLVCTLEITSATVQK